MHGVVNWFNVYTQHRSVSRVAFSVAADELFMRRRDGSRRVDWTWWRHFKVPNVSGARTLASRWIPLPSSPPPGGAHSCSILTLISRYTRMLNVMGGLGRCDSNAYTDASWHLSTRAVKHVVFGKTKKKTDWWTVSTPAGRLVDLADLSQQIRVGINYGNCGHQGIGTGNCEFWWSTVSTR